jgi:hypothetical protein
MRLRHPRVQRQSRGVRQGFYQEQAGNANYATLWGGSVEKPELEPKAALAYVPGA